MKIKGKFITYLSTSIALSSIVSLSVFFNQKTFNNQINFLNLNKIENHNIQILKALNNNLNINSVNKKDFQDYFKNFHPSNFINLNNDISILQYFLRDVVNYNDINENPNAIFQTSLSRNEFYNNYSQMNSINKNIDDVISFQYDSTKNEFSTMMNGDVEAYVEIGKNIRNKFQFENSESKFDFKISKLKAQYDVYIRDQATVSDNNWNENNVADDSIVNPFIVQNTWDKSLIDENLTTSKEIEKYFYDNLILYENNNGTQIKNNVNLNAVLATNLSKEDFRNNNIIQSFFATPHVASGKIEINLVINTNPYGNNSWLEDKDKTITDRRGTFSQLKTDNVIYQKIWLQGWKKDFSFDKLNQAQPIELDADLLDFQNNKMSNFTALQIQKMVSSGQFDDLFKSLIQFKNYENKNSDLKNKLITTNLSFDEFKTLIKNHPFSFIDNSAMNINEIDDFNGIYNGQIKFDVNLVQMHYVNSTNSSFIKFDETLNENSKISFIIKNLKRNIKFTARDFYEDLTTSGYIKLNWISNKTINDFFDVKLDINSKIVSDENIIKIFDKFLEKFIKYKYHNEIPNRDDYGQFPVITNANNKSELEKVLVNLENKDIEFNLEEGTLKLTFNFNKNNNNIQVNNSTNKIIEVKIAGFKSDTSSVKANFWENNKKYNIINIKNINPNITNVNEIDENWILKNLISYNQSTIPNNPYLFSTDISLEKFEKYLLYKSNSTKLGIELIYNDDFSVINGNIYLKKSNLLNRKNLLPSNKDYETYHFHINDFTPKPSYESVNKFDIKSLENSKFHKLDSFSKEFVIENLISYGDDLKEKYILKTNLTKFNFLNKYNKEINIYKDYLAKKVVVKIVNKNFNKNETSFESEIFNFNFEITVDINKNLKIDDESFLLVNTNEKEIINNFMNFLGSSNNKYSILNTNISKELFEEKYLKKINIIEKNYQDNYLELELFFFENKNNLSDVKMKMFFNNKAINIFNVNNSFKINEYENKYPELFDENEILNYISFNNSLGKNESLFNINLSKEEFKNNLMGGRPSSEFNSTNGTILFTFIFNEINVNIIKNDEENSFIKNLTNVKIFEINLYGFKSNAIIDLNLEIDSSVYSEFKNIQSINEVNLDFILNNNLIGLSNAKNILGTTNLNRKEFQQIANLNVIRNGSSAILNFNFKSKVNQDVSNLQIRLNNLFSSGTFDKINRYLIFIIIFGSILTLIIFSGIILLGIYIRHKKNIKKKYNGTVSNKIL